jgi:hypothetical protein
MVINRMDVRPLQIPTRMCAIARDLYLSSSIFAALAAIRFVICYGAPASFATPFETQSCPVNDHM